MKTTFAFITSKQIEIIVKELESEISAYCDIIYLPVDDLEEAVPLYLQYQDKVDAFIFSGRQFYYLLANNIPNITKQCFFFDESKTDLKGIFLQLLLDNRMFDFSRLFIDYASHNNQYLGIKELLKGQPIPYFNELELESYNKKLIDSYNKKLINRHIELHKNNLIDISITRLGVNTKELEKHNIPYIYAHPTKDYIVSFFMETIKKMDIFTGSNQIIGCIVLFMDETSGNDLNIQIIKVMEYLALYSQLNGYDLTIQQKGEHIEVLISFKDLISITNNFSSDIMKNFLDEKMDEQLIIGLGTGHNIYKARLNAQRAASISMQNEGQCFYVSHEDKVIGPLRNKIGTSYDVNPSDELLLLSEKFHMDHMNIQKIIAFCKVSGTTKVSSNMLADYLNVTVRSASRLLTRIEKYGGCISYLENIDGRRGRPKKFFDLTFINNLKDWVD